MPRAACLCLLATLLAGAALALPSRTEALSCMGSDWYFHPEGGAEEVPVDTVLVMGIDAFGDSGSLKLETDEGPVDLVVEVVTGANWAYAILRPEQPLEANTEHRLVGPYGGNEPWSTFTTGDATAASEGATPLALSELDLQSMSRSVFRTRCRQTWETEIDGRFNRLSARLEVDEGRSVLAVLELRREEEEEPFYRLPGRAEHGGFFASYGGCPPTPPALSPGETLCGRVVSFGAGGDRVDGPETCVRVRSCAWPGLGCRLHCEPHVGGGCAGVDPGSGTLAASLLVLVALLSGGVMAGRRRRCIGDRRGSHE